jgi:hypothetical protein
MKLFPHIRKLLSLAVVKPGILSRMKLKRKYSLAEKNEGKLLEELIEKGLVIPAKDPVGAWPEPLLWPNPRTASETLEDLRRDER